MKQLMIGMLVAAMALPIVAAEDAKPAAAADVAAAKPKKKPAKWEFTMVGDALKAADASGEPIIAFFLGEDEVSLLIKNKISRHPLFAKEFAKKNCIILRMTMKKDPKEPKKVDLKRCKPEEREFLDKFVVDPRAVQHATETGNPVPTAENLSNYPCVVGISSDGKEQLFRLPKFDEEGGFGIWFLQVKDKMEEKGITLDISPKVKKVLENPDAYAGAKAKGGAKKNGKKK